MTTPRVRFMHLQPAEDGPGVEAAIRRVIDRGWYVLGPEVEAFEQAFAKACGAGHSVGVGTGTDAIAIILRGLGIGHGDEVITTPLSAAYTALACMMVGARPVFVDLDPRRLTIDPAAIEAAVTPKTAAILPVHLYGQSADMPAIMAIAARHNVAVIEDCCQAHLATCEGKPVGSFGVAAAYSFYPTKNLGALGDGGAITTRDAELAAKMKRIRNGGQTDRYHHGEMGVNSRLDEMQAAILAARLPFLPAWTEARRSRAALYRRLLNGGETTAGFRTRARGGQTAAPADAETVSSLPGSEPMPADRPGVEVPPECDPGHVYHLFPVLSAERDRLQAWLREQRIETLIHYPVPIPRQPALQTERPTPCPVADRVCAQVLSLPMYPGMPEIDVRTVAEAIGRFEA